jgi:hypothetical protein
VAGIRDEEVSGAVYRYAPWCQDAGAGRRIPIAYADTCKRGSVTGKRGDGPGWVHYANSIVLHVRYVEVARAVHR